jgi:hypothetical protein
MNLHELQFAMGMEPLMELSDLEVASATPMAPATSARSAAA